jgi:phage/plasmid-associated DNA primase
VAAGVFGAVSREKATPGVAAWEEALARTRASESAAADGGVDRTRASESESPDDGGEARTRASEPTVGEGAGGGEDGDGYGDGGRGLWRAEGGYFEKDGKKILPGGDLKRARIAIRMLYMPPEQARAGERFTLAWWVDAQQWMRWNGRRYEAVHQDAVRGDVLILYLDWWTLNAEGKLVPAKLSTHQAASIVEALKTDLSVRADGLPAWAPPTIGSDGRPLFDTMREAAASASPHGRPVISFANGLLDLDALRADAKVVLSGHTPRLITTNAMDYPLPVEEIAAELASDSTGEARGGVLCSRLCPGWMKYMSDISKGDDDVPRTLQQYLGYVLGPTCEYERFLYLIGVPGVGKGTFVDVAASLVGPDAVASTSLNKLSGPFAMQPLVGKRVLILDEMGAGHSTDAVEATRCVLSIVGNAPQTVDLKNRDALPQVRLNAKIIATGNRLAKFQDPSDAFGRRVLIVRIPKISRKHDPLFKTKMVAESAGIMVWAIFGLLDLWRSGGFVQPANGMELRKMMRRLSSRVAAFVEDCAVLSGLETTRASGADGRGENGGDLAASDRVSVRASVMYALFEQWSEAKGMKPLAMEDFAADLASITEEFREDTMRVGEDQFSVWHGVRPRLVIDLPGRGDWDDPDLAVSSLTVLGSGVVARLLGNTWYAHQSAAARYAPMGFNTEEAGEDSTV